MSILERINSPADLRRLSFAELKSLSAEIRTKITEVVSRRGGHIGPNLGVVELTLALHYAFDTPNDKLIWDVGHQTYTHKLITGRRDRFPTLRSFKGLSGFPKRKESIYDIFDTGHSSTSLSAAVGFAVARDLKDERYRIIAVIGDGALVAGMALEALNIIGHLKKDMIIILNDNEMSIARSQGAVASYLNKIITGRFYNRLRTDVWNLLGVLPKNLTDRSRDLARKIQEGMKNLLVPGGLFEELGFRYIGPLDGHNLESLITTFERIKDMKGPLIVHAVTKKGKGYRPAEQNPEPFHGIGPFDIETGEPISKKSSYTEVFGDTLVGIANKDPRVIAITAGMCLGTGLVEFRKQFPDRFFDVGICEQHALTFAAGLAAAGLRPVVAIYSTFLQRSYDQLIHDICIQNLPVVFAIDRAGLVGEDGATHHGPFDLSFLRPIPNLVIMAPSDEGELRQMLQVALAYENGPIAIRYPRGGGPALKKQKSQIEPVVIGKAEILKPGRAGNLLALGSMVGPSLQAASNLAGKGYDLGVVNARFVKPLDEELLMSLASAGGKIFTVEEGSLAGGFGSAVMEFFEQKNMPLPVTRIGLPDQFIEHGRREELLKLVGLDVQAIERAVIDHWNG
jgi:1-deoxy-D-xylulose-5-phosphate synthase